jgi:hypothetical protein
MVYDSAFILTDATGSPYNTTLSDIHDRVGYAVSTSMDRPHQRGIQIYRKHAPQYIQGVLKCSATLSFGAKRSPGTLWIENWIEPVAMDSFLPKSNLYGE